MNDLHLVLAEPEPRALFSSIETGSITMRLLFWSGSRRLESSEAKDTIIRAVIRAFRANNVPLATTNIEVAQTPEATN